MNARAEAAGRVAPIPEHVLVKPPSAELAPGQQDETSLGTTYAELDKLLIDYKERGKSVEQLIAAGYDAAEVERITNVWRRMRSSAPSSRNSPLFHTRNSVACGHIDARPQNRAVCGDVTAVPVKAL